MATSYLCLLQGGRNCYITLAFSRVRTKATNSKLFASPLPSRGRQITGIAAYPWHSPPSLVEGTNSELATSPLPSWGPNSIRSDYVTPALWAIPNEGGKLRFGYITHTSGQNCYATPTFSGVPNKGDKIRNGSLIPWPSWGPTSGRSYYVTPAFSAVPNKGDKIRIGYLTLAFFEDHEWAEELCNPCILGAMRQRILGSHTPPCHRRMVITTLFSLVPRCTAAQTSSVPLEVAADCALALAICTSRSARTHHPPRVLVSL